MQNLTLTNTLTKQNENLNLQDDIKMYVCGVTPYDDSHIGHGRCYVAFDILYRVLKALNKNVIYVRNFTDIDDKLLKKEKELGISYKEIADKFINHFHEDMNRLGCLKPDLEPKVTDNIESIISFIQQLIDKDKAYVSENDVYFNTEKFPNYGKLSGKKIDELISGIRVKIKEEKRNPTDFVLWKGNKDNLFWKSPWGYGRPGWHIECSALIKKYLGESIDIHGGGADLIFPHHENEIAQSESLTNKQLSKFWLHNAFVNVNKEKMSKSLGNMFIIKKVFDHYDPMVLRYYFLQHHYTTPMDFSLENLESVKIAYSKLINVFYKAKIGSYDTETPIINEMMNALCDNLNTSKVLAIIFDNISLFKDEDLASEVKSFLLDTLGLTFAKIEQEIKITSEIEMLIKERDIARSNREWDKADNIRNKLAEMGINVNDKKS